MKVAANRTFAEDWKAAQATLDTRAEGWRRKALDSFGKMDLTTRQETSKAFYRAEKDPRLMATSGDAKRLIESGMEATARVLSAGEAQQDADFLIVARGTWSAAFGSAGLVELAERWCRIPAPSRLAITEAVRARTPPAELRSNVRDTALDLGLTLWLRR